MPGQDTSQNKSGMLGNVVSYLYSFYSAEKNTPVLPQEKHSGKVEALQSEEGELEEKQRLANYQLHLNLIIEGAGQSAEWLSERMTKLAVLREPAPHFANTEFKGLPVSGSGNESLLNIVVQNPNLTATQKISLLARLFELGYSAHYQQLLQHPLVQFLLLDDAFKFVLEFVYLQLLKDGRVLPDKLIEQSLWKKLIKAGLGDHVFEGLQKQEAPDLKKMVEFVRERIYASENSLEVIGYFKKLEEETTNTPFNYYLYIINKIAKQHIIEIELNRAEKGLGTQEQSVARLAQFLGLHRYSFWQGGYGTTKSAFIFDLIVKGHNKAAREWYEQEKVKLTGEIEQVLNGYSGFMSYLKII